MIVGDHLPLSSLFSSLNDYKDDNEMNALGRRGKNENRYFRNG